MSLTLNFSSFTPNFLNMQGQIGIFRANGRLGFWDSANSISWSSLFDFADFSPSVETLAGNAIFNAVIGRIVTILPQGDNFVIYATKSIVGVRYSKTSVNILWEATQITSEAGIVYPFQVTSGITELEHFAFTNTGIKRIGDYNALKKSHSIEEVATDIFDLLKETKTPIRLDFLGGRYLFFSTVDPNYINGNVLTRLATAEEYTVRVLEGGGASSINIASIAIGGKTYEAIVRDAVADGHTTGIVLWWKAFGESMVPDRDSPIKHCNFDSGGNLISDAPPSYNTDSLLSSSDVRNLVEGGKYFPPTPKAVSINNGLALKLQGFSPIAAGISLLGQPDSSLNAAIAIQTQEWENYATIIDNTISAINRATQIEYPKVEGYTDYATEEAATEVMELLIQAELVSHPGAYRIGNSVYWEEDAGEIPSGNYTVTTEFPDVGHVFAHAYHKAHFYGGYPIKRLIKKEFSIRIKDRWLGYLTYMTNSVSDAMNVSGPPLVNLSGIYGYAEYMKSLISTRIDESLSTPYVYGNTKEEVCQQLWQWLLDNVPSLNIPYNYEVPEEWTTRGVLTEYRYTIPYIDTAFPLYYVARDLNILSTQHLSCRFKDGEVEHCVDYDFYVIYLRADVYVRLDPEKAHEYYIDHQITKSLSIENYDPDIQIHDSEFRGDQTDLRWGIVTPGKDSEVFKWTDGQAPIPGSVLEGYFVPPFDFTYPGATFLLQSGSLSPVYPEYKGAYVLDLALKKWGKMKATYRALVDYSPINTLQPAIPYSNFGLDMGVLNAAGELFLADAHPADSYILYGKIGYYRLGMTKIEEVKVHFRFPFKGNIVIASSMDGRNLEFGVEYAVSYIDVNNVVLYPSQTGRWHIVKISGQYDLCYLEVRGNIRGRR